MSALDQALIKAYDKPTPRPPAAAAAAPGVTRSAPAPARAANVEAIERIYHEGGLYRVDHPVAAQGGPPAARGASVSGPHYLVPPPTSPKRGVRRSLLRMLAHQQPAAATEPETEPPRIQRKVIIRHVAHRGPVPSPHMPAPPAVQPQSPALAELADMAPAIEVHGHWEAPIAGHAPLVIAHESGDPRLAVQQSLVRLHLDAMPEPQALEFQAAAEQAEHTSAVTAKEESLPQSFVAKSLDDDRHTSIRADQAHARGPRRPHVSFVPAKIEEPLAAEITDEPTVDNEPALADDVQLGGPTILPEPQPQAACAAPARPAAPVWEVDRFHWPRTCEKLLADESGYLAGAGDRLAAAVGDGLKTLAITGSRRGEGRTTLALCLARVAAQAGIQVALVDADFARPTLAARLGLDVAHGWQDAALGHIPLSEAAVKSLADNITVLPLEVSSAGRGLSLADPRVTATLRAAAATFELVIVDLGPLGPGDHIAFPPGEACPLDATIVVRDLRFASVSESQDVGERLYAAGVEAVGVAENFVALETSATTV